MSDSDGDGDGDVDNFDDLDDLDDLDGFGGFGGFGGFDDLGGFGGFDDLGDLGGFGGYVADQNDVKRVDMQSGKNYQFVDDMMDIGNIKSRDILTQAYQKIVFKYLAIMKAQKKLLVDIIAVDELKDLHHVYIKNDTTSHWYDMNPNMLIIAHALARVRWLALSSKLRVGDNVIYKKNTYIISVFTDEGCKFKGKGDKVYPYKRIKKSPESKIVQKTLTAMRKEMYDDIKTITENYSRLYEEIRVDEHRNTARKLPIITSKEVQVAIIRYYTFWWNYFEDNNE